MKDKIEELIATLIQGVDEETLELYDNVELEYWDSGNFDDAFEMGVSVGFDQATLRIAQQLQEIINQQN